MQRWLVGCLAVAIVAGVGVDAAQAAKSKKGKNNVKHDVAAFQRLDKDKDGKLSPTELSDQGAGKKAKKKKANSRQAAHFKKLDKDNSGYLSLAEFTRQIKKKK